MSTKIKTILCPVDFSRHSTDAVLLAAQLAHSRGAGLHLLHTYPVMNNYDFNPATFVPYLAEWNEQARKDSNARMEKLLAMLQQSYPDCAITTEVKQTADTAGHILKSARAHKAEVIVMGSHGRRGFDRILMGSIAESVLRNADCEVLILKPKKTKTHAK